MHRCCINPSILSSCPSTIGNLSTSPTYNLICSGARQHALPVASRCDCAWCPSPWPSGLEADGMPCFRFHLDFTKSSEFFIHSVSIWILFLYICEIHRGTTQPTSATLNFLLRTGRVHWVPSMVKRKKNQLSFGHQPQRRVSQRFIQIIVTKNWKMDENGAFWTLQALIVVCVAASCVSLQQRNQVSPVFSRAACMSMTWHSSSVLG